jgi:hypothetical protein
VKGPSGEQQLLWYAAAPGRTETFREWVHRRDGVTFYSIHGMGRYGDQLVLMAGEYRRVP